MDCIGSPTANKVRHTVEIPVLLVHPDWNGGHHVPVVLWMHGRTVTKEIDAQQKELNELVGFSFNVNSPKQVREVFEPKKNEYGDWQANNGCALEETESGNPSIDATALRSMRRTRRRASQ